MKKRTYFVVLLLLGCVQTIAGLRLVYKATYLYPTLSLMSGEQLAGPKSNKETDEEYKRRARDCGRLILDWAKLFEEKIQAEKQFGWFFVCFGIANIGFLLLYRKSLTNGST